MGGKVDPVVSTLVAHGDEQVSASPVGVAVACTRVGDGVISVRKRGADQVVVRVAQHGEPPDRQSVHVVLSGGGHTDTVEISMSQTRRRFIAGAMLLPVMARSGVAT